MKAKLLLPLLCSLLWVSQASAATRYISDDVYAFLHAGPSNKYRIIGSINAGEKVEFLNRNADTKYMQIKDAEGRTGWIDGRFLQSEESFRSRLPVLEKELTDTQQQLATVDERHSQDVADKVNLIERQQQELTTLKAKLDELSSSHDTLSSENERLTSLMDTKEHQMRLDWLVHGGIVAGIGALVGFVLPAIPLRRRKRQDRWMN
ncbi:TIGR04211 family SH3 domain-containing protein [Oceanimonas baumannii]|uniref:Arylsulfatase n=1 Tax=Oceanimonas baumannii TaxID=129578 RepID=A0A235CNW2_9GAMM|nr:TIGR04211 family SH3 domain-containing protein [Oceanimonas baumannii]MCC4263986.1 TIGR04211 family SH3 domain-containing protein [Oceanimonas baumannii]OYD25545.1 arylsulfatase [Oceanimonas baumannii]TDW61250.1 SH3 domain protein [Oceanimonas baumannii]